MAYSKKFIVRWSEIDLNMHLTSAAYVRYITDTRMNYFEENGFGLPEMKKYNIGPIVLWEKSYYFKEVRPGEEIEIKMWNSGVSDNGTMLRLEQRIYNARGENCFLAYTLVSFLNVIERKMAAPPDVLQEVIDQMPKSVRYKVLEKRELRDAGTGPE